ncbi:MULTISPECIES: hypothetical protein [Pelistega]|nr:MULTISPECIES: hypothetical protein [Pelistega]
MKIKLNRLIIVSLLATMMSACTYYGGAGVNNSGYGWSLGTGVAF